MKMTWLHMEFVLIFITGPSQAKLGRTAWQQLLTLSWLIQSDCFWQKKARRNKLLILIDSIDIAVRGIELVVNICMGRLTPDTGSQPASREAAGGCSSNNSKKNPGKYMNGSQSKWLLQQRLDGLSLELFSFYSSSKHFRDHLCTI